MGVSSSYLNMSGIGSPRRFPGESGLRNDDPERRVEAWGPLPEPAVKPLGLKPGDFTLG
jgi:hypothetical protein